MNERCGDAEAADADAPIASRQTRAMILDMTELTSVVTDCSCRAGDNRRGSHGDPRIPDAIPAVLTADLADYGAPGNAFAIRASMSARSSLSANAVEKQIPVALRHELQR